LISKNW